LGHAQSRVPLLFTWWPPDKSYGHHRVDLLFQSAYDAAYDLREHIRKIIEELKD
jgi:hypothetical protein